MPALHRRPLPCPRRHGRASLGVAAAKCEAFRCRIGTRCPRAGMLQTLICVANAGDGRTGGATWQVAAVVVGGRDASHIESYLLAQRIRLTADDLRAINAVLGRAKVLAGDVFQLERAPTGPFAPGSALYVTQTPPWAAHGPRTGRAAGVLTLPNRPRHRSLVGTAR